MGKWKKIMAGVLCVAMSLGCVGCSDKKKNTDEMITYAENTK